VSLAFGKRMEDLHIRVNNRVTKRLKQLIRRTAKGVIDATPYETGRLKNNWYSSMNGFPRSTNKSGDVSGKASLGRVDKALAKFDLKKNQTFYMANNLPYARVVEFGLYPNPPKKGRGKTVNGFSKKAPAGMARINIRKAVAEIRAGVKK